MAYKLVCTAPFHGFNKGDVITDPGEVETHLAKRDHHFVKVRMSPDEEESVKAAIRETAMAVFAKA